MQNKRNKQFLTSTIISVIALVLIILSVPFTATADEDDLINDEDLSVIEAENNEVDKDSLQNQENEGIEDAFNNEMNDLILTEPEQNEAIKPEEEGNEDQLEEVVTEGNEETITEEPIDKDDETLHEAVQEILQQKEPQDNSGEYAGQVSEVQAPQKINEANSLKVTVVLDTAMDFKRYPQVLNLSNPIFENTDVYVFSVNGKEISVHDKEPYLHNGRYEFTHIFEDIPSSDIDLKMVRFSNKNPSPAYNRLMDIFSVVGSNYDSENQRLTVNIGRNVRIAVSRLIETNVDEFPDKYYNAGYFTLELFDPSDKIHPIKTSDKLEYSYGGIALSEFKGLLPGTYLVKIKNAPEKFQDYNFDNFYQLDIDPDGMPRIEIYQWDSSQSLDKYNVTYAAGMSPDIALKNLPQMVFGCKTPLLILIAKNNPVEKVILDSNEAKSDMEVYKNDIVTFQLKKKISPDHKTILYSTGFYKGIYNCGTYCNQSFSDILDERLEYIDGSLQVTLDGKATSEYVARYEKNEHKIVVDDNSQPNILEFDDNTTAVLPDPQELIVTFQAKVLKADDTIYNTVDNSTVRLIPFKVEGHKIWQDQDNQDNKRPESIVVRLLANGAEVANKTVSANEDWSWSFVDLPRVDNNGNLINYSVKEDPVAYYESEVNGYNITNTYNPETPPPPTHPKMTVTFPTVIKKVEGGEPLKTHEFTFQLEAISYRPPFDEPVPDWFQMPMPEDSENGKKLVTITGEGTNVFGAVTYEYPGEYTYRITELPTDSRDYKFSKLVYTVTDRVYEVDGELQYERHFVLEGSDKAVTAAYFINQYVVKPSQEQITELPKTGERSYAPVIAVSLISLAILGLFRKNHGSN